MIVRRMLAGLLVLGASCMAGCTRSPVPPAAAQIDHVILGVSDLDQGIVQLGALCGAMPVPGGRHEHTGTHNALLSTGSHAYVEVLAPQRGVELPRELQPLRSLASLTPVGWAVAIEDAEVTMQTLRAAGYGVNELQEGSRQTPEGNIIRWRAFQLTTPGREVAPFFIEWNAASAHPSETAPRGCSLGSLELRTPHDEELRRLLSLLKVEGRVVQDDVSLLVVTLKGPHGSTELRPPRGLLPPR